MFPIVALPSISIEPSELMSILAAALNIVHRHNGAHYSPCVAGRPLPCQSHFDTSGLMTQVYSCPYIKVFRNKDSGDSAKDPSPSTSLRVRISVGRDARFLGQSMFFKELNNGLPRTVSGDGHDSVLALSRNHWRPSRAGCL